MEIVTLPSSPEPKLLTAKAVLHRLGDHLQSFLAHNNLSSYLKDPDYVLQDNLVSDVLLGVAYLESVDYLVLKRKARHLANISKKTLKLGKSLELMARALGYKTWRDVVHSLPEDNQVINVWLDSKASQLRLFDDTELTKGEARIIYDNPTVRKLMQDKRNRKVK